MKVCIITLGCKVNQYESAVAARGFIESGHSVSHKLQPADLYIVNTCAVTSFAEKKSRYEVARIRKLYPNARIRVCGCASEYNPGQFAGNNTEVSGTVKDFSDRFACQGRRIAYIKAQDGCNNFCSYCIVPHLRGRSRSRPVDSVIAEISQLKNDTVILTGIDLSSYGSDAGTDLGKLCLRVDGCGKRFELSSLEVRVITPEFLSDLSSCNNFVPHFHLSLQSGCDDVLRAMNRRYTCGDYADRVNLIRRFFPHAVLTTDLIVGFPAETDDDFFKTLEFVKSMGFAKVHVFPYSRRSGTKAAEMKPLADFVIFERVKVLKENNIG